MPATAMIEIVEGANRNLARHATFRRIRIDVIKALEVGGILHVAEQRQRMPPRKLARSSLRVSLADRRDA